MINHVAPLHAELLFIHPFREGNGLTARLFADLIALKSGFDRFIFEKITEKRMPKYITAVQSAADKNYEPMIQLFRSLKKLNLFETTAPLHVEFVPLSSLVYSCPQYETKLFVTSWPRGKWSRYFF